MEYEVEVGGRVRQVTIARTGETFAVTVDGHVRHLDVARTGARTLSLLVDSVSSKDVVISVGDTPGHLTVLLGTIPVALTIHSRADARRRSRNRGDGPARERASGTGPQRVTAPMPGKVVRVLVKVGDAVVARQPVVVIEAMKMENELRAPRDGQVTEVRAHEGASVDAGALLIVIE